MSDATQKYVRIPLTQGKYAVIDIEDFAEIGKYTWQAHPSAPRTRIPKSEGGGFIYMHRKIMNPPDGMLIDHKDRNTLNNTRANLRFCSHSENTRNSKPLNTKSGFKGVKRQKNRWVSRIKIEGKRLFLGSFIEIQDAVNAYKEASVKYHGEFGRTEETPFEDYSHIPIVDRLKRIGPKSGISGVVPSGKKWMSHFYYKGKQTYLGTFLTKEEAAEKIDQYKKLHP